jgi:formate dehydrogenase iron-sulfur subunit
MAHMARYAMEFCATESCGKCTPCRIGSTRGVELIDQLRKGGSSGGDREAQLQRLESLCDTMAEGSLCGLGAMTPFPVRSAVKYFRADFLKQRTPG